MNEQDLQFDRRHIWHPYTSLTEPLPCYPIKRASGVYLTLSDGRNLIDGMSSWWASIFGYDHPVLTRAAHRQLSTISHVMFGGLTHRPAIEVCRQLVEMTPHSLECVFLADSGSVAVEVALKMAWQYWQAQGQSRPRFVALKHAYHGDTLGAMSICDPKNSMHTLYRGALPMHYFADAPRIGFYEDWRSNEMHSLETLFAIHHREIAALVLEPIVQGAGGMRFYHPRYLYEAKQICDRYGILLIADEIATGFGRTGRLFACEHAEVIPDILCVGKALTGGYMTLSATLTTRHIADTLSGGEAGCFMHGPTFMGNPLACAVASANLTLLVNSDWQGMVQRIEMQLHSELMPLKTHPNVHDVRVLGAIGVVETKQRINIAEAQAFFVAHGVWIRPFGHLLYIMPPYIISFDQLRMLTFAITAALDARIFIN